MCRLLRNSGKGSGHCVSKSEWQESRGLSQRGRHLFPQVSRRQHFPLAELTECIVFCWTTFASSPSARQEGLCLPSESIPIKLCTRLTISNRDLKSYQDTVVSFNVPSLLERYEFIRQLGNVFLVRPEILRSYITENYLGRIEPSLLKPYLAQRSDWLQFENRFNESSETEDTVADLATKGLKDRFKIARLSTMMKELEGLKLGDGIAATIPVGIAHNFNAVTGRG